MFFFSTAFNLRLLPCSLIWECSLLEGMCKSVMPIVLFKLTDRKDWEGFGMKHVEVPSDLVYNHPYWICFSRLTLNRWNLKLCILSTASRLQKKCSLHCAFYLVLLTAFCVDSATVLSRSLPLCCCPGEFLQLEDGSNSSDGKLPNFIFLFPFPVPVKIFTGK